MGSGDPPGLGNIGPQNRPMVVGRVQGGTLSPLRPGGSERVLNVWGRAQARRGGSSKAWESWVCVSSGLVGPGSPPSR